MRKAIFWIHLICGVAAALVIAMMSATGVLLTYERQMLAAADAAGFEPVPGARRAPIEDLLAAVRTYDAAFTPTAITVPRDAERPASVSAGRGSTLFVDPYRAEVLGAGAERLRGFFRAVTGWHRWFNADAESRALPRAITGASNLIFLFLILSGSYLWLPKVWRWAALRTRLWFNPLATTAKARDFNWHHVFGIWTAVPLAVVVATATVFSYPWASDLVYRSFGEEPPRRGGGPRVERIAAADTGAGTLPSTPPVSLPLDRLFERAAAHLSEWNTITMTLPGPQDETVRFTIDQGNGGEPQRRHTLALHAGTGEVAAWQPFDTQSPGQRARSLIRFLHTGEALGIAGQTVAGIVSLTSLIMVWTGLALAYRRLIVPLYRR